MAAGRKGVRGRIIMTPTHTRNTTAGTRRLTGMQLILTTPEARTPARLPGRPAETPAAAPLHPSSFSSADVRLAGCAVSAVWGSAWMLCYVYKCVSA